MISYWPSVWRQDSAAAALQCCRLPLSVSAALGALRDEGCQPLHLPASHWSVSLQARVPIGPLCLQGCSNPDDWRSLQSLGRGHCRVCRAAICSHLVRDWRLSCELCAPCVWWSLWQCDMPHDMVTSISHFTLHYLLSPCPPLVPHHCSHLKLMLL